MSKGKGEKREKKKDKVKPDYLDKNPFEFESIDKWVWRKFDGFEVIDPREFIREFKNRRFIVSSDSQNYPKSRKCVFASTLIAWDYDEAMGCGHGARAIKHVDVRRIVPVEALSSRLTVETQRSIELCRFLE